MAIVDLLRHALLYLVLPVWFAAGFADYLCHRAALIERTSGPKESLLHVVQFALIGLPLLAVLFLEVNAGVILLMAVGVVLHQAAAIWDVRYANHTRRVSPTEQHLHGVLEAVPVPMLKVPWSHFGDRHPQAHLVVASFSAAQEVGSSDVKTTQYVLERLIRSQVPMGNYATASFARRNSRKCTWPSKKRAMLKSCPIPCVRE